MKNRLKYYREKKGLSQIELSKKSGVSRATIINLETGKARVAKTDTLTRIADSLEMSVSEVFMLNDWGYDCNYERKKKSP